MCASGRKMNEKEVFQACLCPACPSWVNCGEQGGFCMPKVGRSKCIKQEKGCICDGCMVHKMFGLRNNFYCTRGSEEEQKGKR